MPYTRKIGRQKSINIAEGGAAVCFHINCRGALLYPIAIFILVAIQLYSNSSNSINVSQLKYYYSFSGSGNATVLSGEEEGKQQQQLVGITPSSSFFWEASDNCHAVDNICYDTKNEKWFYFENSEQHQDGAFRQPSMVLYNAGHVHFDVASAAATKKPKLSQLNLSLHYHHHEENEEQLQTTCTLSKVNSHVVVRSNSNDMIGEFYAGTVEPMSRMIKMHPIDDPKNLQLYVHLMKGSGKIFDGHKLFLSPFSNNTPMSWIDMFTKDDEMNQHTGDRCQCYRQFVMCGYEVAKKDDDAKCDIAMSKLGLLPIDIQQTLCRHGVSLNTMSRMDEDELYTMLSKVIITDNTTTATTTRAQAQKVTNYLRENPVNVALNGKASATSLTGGFRPRFAFDGVSDTKWVSEKLDNESLTVDLVLLFNISKVVILWVGASGAYDIQVSTNNDTWTTVASHEDGDEEIESVLSTNITCRYVRMQGNKASTEG